MSIERRLKALEQAATPADQPGRRSAEAIARWYATFDWELYHRGFVTLPVPAEKWLGQAKDVAKIRAGARVGDRQQ